jgi:myo-inositol-1(or 4)-monophosphatase
MNKRLKDLDRILEALRAGKEAYQSRSMDSICVGQKSDGDPVTDVEREVNQLLFGTLVRDGEGWLSEETEDSSDRLIRSRIWIVDPLDGTKEYVSRIPEWCISIALLEEGRLVAGGICNPLTGELFYGSSETGVVYECDSPDQMENSDFPSQDPLVLASRSEVKRGEWERFRNAPFTLKPMGSVAYKLARVATGKADATWTLVPKHEWDVAGWVALMQASGGRVLVPQGTFPAFNRCDSLLPGLVALSQSGIERLQPFLNHIASDPTFQDCLPWVRALTQRHHKA